MKIKRWYLLAFILLLFLLDTASIKVFGSGDLFIPQFLLLLVIVFAINYSFTETLWFSFGIGFFAETVSGFFFGAEIVALVLTGLIVYSVTRKLTSQEISFLMAIVLVVVSTFVLKFCLYGYSATAAFFNLANYISLKEMFSLNLFWTALANFLVFYPVLFVFKFLKKDERSFQT